MKQKLIAQDLHDFGHTFAFGMGVHDAHFACTMASQEWPHTGKAYLTMQKSGSWVDWYDLEVPQEGDYTLIVRYANPDNPAARLVCKVNESGESIRVLEPTAVHFYTRQEDWRHNWKICRFTCTLRAGSNCLRLSLGEGCDAPVLLDSLAFTTGTVSAISGQVYDVRNFGARGDGQTLDTQAIQSAINACAGSGGTVLLSGGVFLTGTLRLGSSMTFYLSPDATLLGAMDKSAYPVFQCNPGVYIQEFRPGFKQLLLAQGVEDLTLTGGGRIDLQGDWDQWTGHEFERPVTLFMASSRNLRVTNLDMAHGACWNFILLECQKVLIDGLNIDSRNHINRDAIDPVDCHEVLISNCAIIAGDDAICPKSGTHKGVRGLHVWNIALNSGGANGIKFGSSSWACFKDSTFEQVLMTHVNLAGISLGVSDGAEVEGIRFARILMNHVRVPLSILNGAGIRGRRPDGSPKKKGYVRSLYFDHMEARNVTDPLGSHIDGTLVDGQVYTVEDVSLRHCRFACPGGFDRPIPADPPEYNGEYPDYYWCDPFMPAWGLYARHVRGLVLEDFECRSQLPDPRPERKYVDVEGLEDWS